MPIRTLMVMVNSTRCLFGQLQQYTRVIDICLTEKPVGTKLGINSQRQLASFRGNVRASLNLAQSTDIHPFVGLLYTANKAATRCPNNDE